MAFAGIKVCVALVLLVGLFFLNANDVTVEAQTIRNVRATYNYYNAAANNYELSGLYCATWDATQSYQWRSQYRWTAYCVNGGPAMGQSLCGRCLRVTNQDTQQSIVVRILDQCANGGLDLDWDALTAIDGNGAGFNAGHMTATSSSSAADPY